MPNYLVLFKRMTSVGLYVQQMCWALLLCVTSRDQSALKECRTNRCRRQSYFCSDFVICLVEPSLSVVQFQYVSTNKRQNSKRTDTHTVVSKLSLSLSSTTHIRRSDLEFVSGLDLGSDLYQKQGTQYVVILVHTSLQTFLEIRIDLTSKKQSRI